jgi:hypothetical protein
MKTMKSLTILAMVLALLAGCAQVGDRPVAATTPVAGNSNSSNPDRFTFKIPVAGALAGQTTEQRALKEIEYYRSHNGYNSYEIVRRDGMGSPVSYYEYEVQFAKVIGVEAIMAE